MDALQSYNEQLIKLLTLDAETTGLKLFDFCIEIDTYELDRAIIVAENYLQALRLLTEASKSAKCFSLHNVVPVKIGARLE